ncbi:hypothetical protein K491DRAFT_710639 [Lophiostoma macrostomum CBS 122681]|uniref:Uncharacterized protein n=1 Tax=Lophiostoma macrostomum CBS 122681 TaxID=1314788 RepID=A0A6A6TR58_9PLEO|nr:hypothetical protein K491DRAFT_710639 [Lophiostoma macrostomum CBS 122681]
MGAIGNLIPLVVLGIFVAGAAWVGYQVYLYSNQLAERGVRKMEKKNVVFTKDGARVGVKEIRAEEYADKTQRAFVNTWNAAQDGESGKKNTSGSRSASYSSSRPTTVRSSSSRTK